MAVSLALDLLVSGLLAVTICYAMVLNKKIGNLRRDKAELQKMAATFNAATTKAEKSIKALKNTAENLGERIEKANALRDDLMFLTERGSSAADKLETLVRTARDQTQTQTSDTTQVPDENRKTKFSAADMAALRKGVPDRTGVTDFPKRQAPNKSDGEIKRRQPVVSRSDAERELIHALQLAR